MVSAGDKQTTKDRRKTIKKFRDAQFRCMMRYAITASPFGKRLQRQYGLHMLEWPYALLAILLKRRRKGTEIKQAVRIMCEMGFLLHQQEILLELNVSWVEGKPLMSNRLRARNLKHTSKHVVNVKDTYILVLKEYN